MSHTITTGRGRQGTGRSTFAACRTHLSARWGIRHVSEAPMTKNLPDMPTKKPGEIQTDEKSPIDY